MNVIHGGLQRAHPLIRVKTEITFLSNFSIIFVRTDSDHVVSGNEIRLLSSVLAARVLAILLSFPGYIVLSNFLLDFSQ